VSYRRRCRCNCQCAPIQVKSKDRLVSLFMTKTKYSNFDQKVVCDLKHIDISSSSNYSSSSDSVSSRKSRPVVVVTGYFHCSRVSDVVFKVPKDSVYKKIQQIIKS
jgi:hypothetical protein